MSDRLKRLVVVLAVLCVFTVCGCRTVEKPIRKWRRLGRPVQLRLIGLLLCTVGGAMALWGTIHLGRGLRSRRWPTTQGVVESAEMTHRYNRYATDIYGARVEYRYEVAGRTYHATRVSYGQYESSHIGHAEAILRRYPPGAGVSVHYHPARPNVAVLEPGVSLNTWVLPILGGAFFLIGVLALSWTLLGF